VPDPFQFSGACLYRTGEPAQWRPDGILEFSGGDDQVKDRAATEIEPARSRRRSGASSDRAGGVVRERGRQMAKRHAYIRVAGTSMLRRRRRSANVCRMR